MYADVDVCMGEGEMQMQTKADKGVKIAKFLRTSFMYGP